MEECGAGALSGWTAAPAKAAKLRILLRLLEPQPPDHRDPGDTCAATLMDLETNCGTCACELGRQCLFENKGDARLDCGFSYRVYHGFELYGWIYNFLDKHYEDYQALPLNFMAGIRSEFQRTRVSAGRSPKGSPPTDSLDI